MEPSIRENLEKIGGEIKVPYWVLIVLGLVIVSFVGFTDYSSRDHRQLKRAYADSLKIRERKIDSLEVVLSHSDEFQENTSTRQRTYYNEYKKEQKLRKDAEAKLFIYRNNNRVYIDSFLSNYKYRRIRAQN